ncbi:hypothetical protein TWF481_009995 [Arthrobotrys musiformis]|uniref:Fungal N-terminal domain-containing protein n=1 Tax=Arthrobotrys musiformis TaxID=47236 RepID=A0AAV9VZP4_9PEZI
MAEVAGLVLGSVALVPLIKNVRHIYDSIKDAPQTLKHYQESISRLLDTLEVIHATLTTSNAFPENSRPRLAFEGYLADINNSCTELQELLRKKLKADGCKIDFRRRALWSFLGRDDKAKELMSKIERTARSLHLLYDGLMSMANSAMYNTYAAQVNISTNAWITSGDNIASILAEVAAIKIILQEVRADSIIHNSDNGIIVATKPTLTLATDLESPTENNVGDSSSYEEEEATSTIICRRQSLGPIKEKSNYYIFGRSTNPGALTTVLSKTQLTGRQSGIILQSQYEIQVRLSFTSLGFNLYINLGLETSSRGFYPRFGLRYQRIVPESDLQYYYVKHHMFEEFRDLVVQRRASIYDRYNCDRFVGHGTVSIMLKK